VKCIQSQCVSHSIFGLLSSSILRFSVYLSDIFIYIMSPKTHVSLQLGFLIQLSDRYFLINDKGEKIEEQTGTVRTNCIDCLDRTNVTQVHTSKLYHIHIFFCNYS